MRCVLTDRHEERWQSSYSLCQALAKDCVELKAPFEIEQFALEGVLRSHRELGLPEDEQWAEIATALLRNEARRGGTRQPGKDFDQVLRGLKELENAHIGEECPQRQQRLS